jgi:FkbM family methyltransferase
MEEYFKNVVIKENITHIKIDIGLSYNAPQSRLWLEKEANLLVIGFEPHTESIKNIETDVIPKNIFMRDRFFIFPVALQNVNEPCEMKFYKTRNDPGTSSLYKPIDKKLGMYKEEASVQVYSLKHFFEFFPFDKFGYIEYIKIDAQGSDYDILLSAGDYLRERVVFITAEPEDSQYENCNHNNTKNIEEYLLSQNFVRIYDRPTSDPTFLNKKFQHLADTIYIQQL